MHNLFDDCGCYDAQNNATKLPLLGDVAPDFVAETTNGRIKFPDDYLGKKWVVLFSHPGDFTPVCTTEFIAFQSLITEFEELNTELVGLSVGTLTGHLAWINAISAIKYKGMKNIKISFPIINDIKMEIAKKYGMIQPNASGTKAIRAVFIIDPAGIIRTILYYPLTTGRNFTEIKRILVALQTTDAFSVSTPADWVAGAPVVVPAPSTAVEMDNRINNTDKALDVKAWFLTLKDLPEDEIWIKLHKKLSKKK